MKEDILKNTQPAESTEPTEPTPPDGVKKLNIGRESAGFRTPCGGGDGVHTDIFSKYSVARVRSELVNLVALGSLVDVVVDARTFL